MLNTKKLIIFFALAVPTLCFGQQVLTLEEIFKRINENNITLKAYESRIKSADARVAGAGSWMAPMVGLGTFMTPYPGATVMEDSDRGAWMVAAEQDIPNPAKTKAKREYLKSRSQTFFYGRNEQFNQLRSRARELYFDLLISYKRLRFQQESLDIMKNMKKLAEIRYPYNQSNLGLVFKSEGREFEASNMLEMTQSKIKTDKIYLNALMNVDPNADFMIDTIKRITFTPIAGLDTAYLADRRSDIRQMQQEIYSMQANINQMRQEAKPDFRIRYEHMSNRSPMMPNQYTLMGMISIPIAPWSSKMYKSEVKSMGLEREAMIQQKQGMLTEMLGMVKSMETELITMQKQLSNYELKILPALSKNLKVSMLSYQENKSDLANVIDAWEAVNMAQMNYVDQLERFYKMISEYEKNIER